MKVQNDTVVIYRNKPFYLWFTVTAMTIVAVPIIAKQELDIIQIATWVVILLLVGHFSIKEMIFKRSSILFNYPLRIFSRKKNIKYEDLLFLEIRNRKEPYQRPYIILHFSEKKIKNKFIWYRSGIYKTVDELIPLVKHLCQKRVRIKLSMTSENTVEFNKLRTVIQENEGLLFTPSQQSNK